MLCGLANHHDVTLLSFADQPEVHLDASEVQKLCADVYVIPWREFDPNSVRARFGFLSLMPRSLIDTFSSDMADKIVQLLQMQKYDLVIASQLSMAAYYAYFKNTPAIFEELEIGLSYGEAHDASDLKKRLRHTFTWFKLRRYLGQLLKFFGAVTVVSEKEQELLVRFFPHVKNVQVLPNCVNMDDYAKVHSERKPNTLVFTGSFRYHVNYEAMLWFVGEVFPLILESVPDAELLITGDHANLPLPSKRNITLSGYVDDIKPLVASAAVSIVPLWSGGGTRLKILEAMAIGTPVVATTKGAEGLDVKADVQLFIADEPVKFADCVVRLLSEKNLRHFIAEHGKQLIKEKYDWKVVLPKFFDLLQETALK